jgi:putative methionine-R-sulfoxide reductase with GAF domain
MVLRSNFMIQHAGGDSRTVKRSELFNYIDRLFEEEMIVGTPRNIIATTFNSILKRGFETVGLEVPFVGQYEVNSGKPSQAMLYLHQGTEACPFIKLEEGIIGRALRTGRDQIVQDVRQDPDHHTCDTCMVGDNGGSEYVFVTFSDRYTTSKYGAELVGARTVKGVLDLDIKGVNALTKKEIKNTEVRWRKFEKLIFPGEADYRPPEEMFVSKNGRK